MVHYTFLVPILIRIGFMVAIPTAHYLFHKAMHAGIHLSEHKLESVGKLMRRFKFLPDIIMVIALIALHYFTE